MPLYEYHCPECDHQFEQFVRSSSAVIEIHCPNCGGEKSERLFSAFATRSAGSRSSAGASSAASADCGPVG